MARTVEFGTPVIDALRLCYVAEPSLLKELGSLNLNSCRTIDNYLLYRVPGDRFEFFFIVCLDSNGSRTELGTLKYGRYGATGSNFVYYQIRNEVLYDRSLFNRALLLPDLLGLFFNNFTAVDIAMDFQKNVSSIIKRMMRNEKITTIINGKAMKDRKELINGVTFDYSSSLSRLHCPTITLRQAKAARNKTKGVTVQSYDKKAEIEAASGKQYILDQYGHPRFLFRLEVRLSYQDLQDYFKRIGQPQNVEALLDPNLLADMYYSNLSSVLRFTKGRKPLPWKEVLERCGRI